MSSLIYRNIHFYRATMNLLYAGAYRQRFLNVIALIGNGPRSVCDLCFGDTVIADWCRKQGVRWTGVDVNAAFCERARRQGFAVIQGDILALDLPTADVFVMAGSLYHFHDCLSELFDRIFERTSRFVLSEPVQNLSSRRGLLGSWAKHAAHPGTIHATFRYNAETLMDVLGREASRLGLTLRVVSSARDMIVVIERAATPDGRA